MKMGNKGKWCRGLMMAAAVCVLLPAVAQAADTSILAYPSTACVLRYDPVRYEVIGPGDPNYESNFAIAGGVLWDKIDSRIPTEIYQAYSLVAFEPSSNGRNEFVTLRNEFWVTVDGYSASPRFLGNIMVRFLPVPGNSTPMIQLDGVLLNTLTVPLGNLNVLSPTSDGNYSDTLVHRLRWSGAAELHVVVFSDKNFNGIFDDGPPLFTLVAEDNTVPVEEKTWGAVKALYR